MTTPAMSADSCLSMPLRRRGFKQRRPQVGFCHATARRFARPLEIGEPGSGGSALEAPGETSPARAEFRVGDLCPLRQQPAQPARDRL